ncbi:recombinase family protein [Nonomuraea sp. NPDC059194]|uniref:recombinase family protein n=1 Tax=Nonomuraea sp. NPDC059194 TaxID=3346764 RepID=UPI0036B9887E
MTDRVYLRYSTDKQTDARQRHALAALLAAGAPAYEDPATSSRQLSLDRAGFTRLLHEAAVGDTIRIADAARLFRSVADILALRPVLARRGLHLRVESGLLSGIDLASDDPGTKMMVSVLAAVLEFQRDMISENTREGVAAAEAFGKTLGRPTALDTGRAADVVEAYRSGTAIKPSPDSTTSPPRPSAGSWTAPAPANCPTNSTRSRPRANRPTIPRGRTWK